jgi:hypothetical protein
VAGLFQMVHLRFVDKSPIVARASGCSCPLFGLGCTRALWIELRRDYSPRQGVCSGCPDSPVSDLPIISVAWRSHGADVSLSRADPRRPVECHLWERGRDHRGHRRALQRRSPDCADVRMYPTRPPFLTHVYRTYTDARVNII